MRPTEATNPGARVAMRIQKMVANRGVPFSEAQLCGRGIENTVQWQTLPILDWPVRMAVRHSHDPFHDTFQGELP